ncbi:hypothetical protein [Moraxella marmotae]|uniref:hypothetical protein n=1 Tax=Moraxella marmotae TaxID=3344520 RepID=UPI0035F48ECD
MKRNHNRNHNHGNRQANRNHSNRHNCRWLGVVQSFGIGAGVAVALSALVLFAVFGGML